MEKRKQLKIFNEKTLDQMVREGKRNRHFYEHELRKKHGCVLPSSDDYWVNLKRYETQRGFRAYILNKEYFDAEFHKREGFWFKLKNLYRSFKE